MKIQRLPKLRANQEKRRWNFDRKKAKIEIQKDIVQKLNENWRQNQKQAEKKNEINTEKKKEEKKRMQREKQKEKTKIIKEKMNTPIPALPKRPLCQYEKIREQIIKERKKAMRDSGFFKDLAD